jgi:phage terminase large subunit GpA-like protein
MTLSQQLERALRDVFAPVDTREVWQWAEDEIVLTRRQTETPGPYSTLLTPYIREPLNCFADPRVSDLTLCFGTQTSKTTAMMIGTAWRMVNNPFPSLWVMPTESMARSFSENRWQPMVEDCHPLAALKPYNTHRYKTLEQQFRDATLTFVGSNSPSSLASRPAGLLVMDETDKFSDSTDKESSAVALATNRTKSYTNALRVMTSTPTLPDGEIWRAFLAGDQRYYFVPCPHCEEMQRLEFTQIKWDTEAKRDRKWDMEAVRASAYYQCTACNGKITDGHKTRMLRHGEWRPTNPNASFGHRSFHLNSLYAPWRSCTFGALAVKFLRDKDTINGLQDFTNSTMAMPWEQVETSIGEQHILALRGDYQRGTCPIEPRVIVTCADIGQDKQHWVTTAFAEDGSSHVLDYGTTLAIEDLLLDAPRRAYTTPSGQQVAPECGLLDSGFATFRVYAACQSSAGFYHPAKGSGATFGSKISRTTIPEFSGIVLYTFVDHAIKTELFTDRIRNAKPPVKIPADVSEDFLRGLSGQRLVPRKTASGTDLIWKSVAQDHFMDALKLCHIAWHILKN